MTWRRGELWFDTDVLWFGERAAAPALAGLAPLPRRVIPDPGLVASRLRRAAWTRRREARRAKATAIALSPAVMFALAGMRSAGDPGVKLAIDDPPSMTFRLGVGSQPITIAPDDLPRVRPRPAPALTPAEKRQRLNRVIDRREVAPLIQWRHAISEGVPWSGALVDGTQLPVEGPSWVTWDPVTDTVPNLPDRLYGNERTIRTVIAVANAYHEAHPNAPRIVVGDISHEGGGPMTDEHVSHQNGLDVDIYYPRTDGAERDPGSPNNINRWLAQDLVDRFVAAGAQMIFVGYSTGLHGPGGVVIPYAYHDNHMHVRFPPS
jgi:hypothetical protein